MDSSLIEKNTLSGFTLVELAIVLMIIGLLIGGVLRGQELMNNGRITKTIQQVKAYQGAVTTFRDAYAAFPGDMALAMQRVAGCTTDNSCANGNGDGIIGVMNGSNTDQPWGTVANAISSENTQFWKHLALAHLVTGVTPNAATPEWGRSHPSAKFGGGFFARYSSTTSFINVTSHLLVLRNTISGGWSCNIPGQYQTCSISGMNASQIDRKMDDGVALTGDVFGISGDWGNGCGIVSYGLNGPNGYAVTNDTTSCDMMFKL